MADSQNPGEVLNDPDLNLFDFDDYYGEQATETENTLTAHQAPDTPPTSNQVPSIEPHQEQVSLSEAPTASFFEDTAMIDIWDSSWEQQSMPATNTRNEPLRQHEQLSSTDNVTAELHQIETEEAEVKLKLEQCRLQRRRRELLQRLPTRQPIQPPKHPQFQNLEPAIGPSVEGRMGQDYNAPFGYCELDASQSTNPGIDSHYDLGSTNSSNMRFSNLSSNPQEEPFNLRDLEQPEMINAGLLNSHTAQSSNNMPTPSTDLEHNRQYGMQGPSPAFSSDNMSMQPSSMSSPHGLDLMSSTPLLSTTSSVQHDQQIQSPGKGLISQKRPRSPQPNMAECLSALQRQAKQTGVPQTSLNVMSFNPEPRPKRPRTRSQKQNKKDVQDAGGSCLLCLMFKKQCSGQRPCQNCEKYWQQRAYRSTSFTWTCDVHTKLTDFNIFKYPMEGISLSEIANLIGSQPGGSRAFWGQFDSLSSLADFAVFVCLITVIKAHKLPCKDEAVVIIAIVYHEIKNPTEIETSDLSVLSHLKEVLESRLKVFCSRIPGFDASEKVKSSKETPNTLVALMVSQVKEFSSYVPPRYKSSVAACLSRSAMLIPVHAPSKPRNLPACLLRRFDDGECCDGNSETDDCCCGWILDSIPSTLLKFFGHSKRSFASYVHSDSWKTRLQDVDVPFDPRQAFKAMFKDIGKDDSSLKNGMPVFGGALLIGFWSLIDLIDSLTRQGGITKRIKLPEDQLVRLAGRFRQRLFGCILPPAVTMYHEFWNSERGGTIHALTNNELFFDFFGWASKRPDSKTNFVTEELARILLEDLLLRLYAK